MSYWTDALAHGPALLAKLNDGAGVVAVDSSGNGRNGVIAGSPVFSTGIIPNVPVDGSITLDGVNDEISWADAAWMDPSAYSPTPYAFTCIQWVKVSNFSVQRDFFGKLNEWQTWLETTGKITLYLTPAWTSVLSGPALAANTLYMVAVVVSGTGAGATGKLYVNGVEWASYSHTANLANSTGILYATQTGNSRRWPGQVQGFEYITGKALSAAQLLALYNSGMTSPTIPPTDPSSLTISPASPSLISVSWLPSTDPDGVSANIVYGKRYWDGSVWTAIAGTTATLSYDWIPPSAVRGLSGVKFSVRAIDEAGGVSAWVDSEAFIVPSYTPADIAVSVTTPVTEISWVLTTNADGEYWDGVQWRTLFTDLNAQAYNWDSSKRKGTAVKVRIRSRDGAGVTGAWVESATFDLTGKFVGSVWKALQSYASLEGLWKFNEATTILPVDSSGKGRNITNTGTFPAGRPSILFNRPTDTSRRHQAFGSGPNVLHSGGTWYDALVTLLVWIKPAVSGMGGSSGNHLILFNRASIQGRATDATHLELQVNGFAALDLGVQPTVGATSMLTLVAPKGAGSRVAVYVNATNRYAATLTTSATAVNQIGAVGQAVDADWAGFAALSEELDALQVAWIHQVSLNTPNDPPAIPGAFTEPDAGVDYDLTIAVAWGVSVDPQADAVEYLGEYWDPEQLLWLSLFDWQAGATFAWDVSDLIQFDGYKVRVKARDIYEEESDWQTSGTFDIVHDRVEPNTPWLEWIWGSFGYVGFYGSAFSSLEVGASARSSLWRISASADMGVIIGTWRVYGPNYRLGWNPKTFGLAYDADYWVDVQYEDQVGIWGPRSAPVRGRTLKNAVGGGRYIVMKDSGPYARHGTYGTITGTDGASFLNHDIGGDGFSFPGKYLVGARPDAAGAMSMGGPVKGMWRVYNDDPNVIDQAGRSDGLLATLPIYIPGTLDGIPVCDGPSTTSVSMGPDWGMLLRLFLPKAMPAGYRYGVVGFHTGIHHDSPLIGSPLIRIYYQSGGLNIEGYRGYYGGITDRCNPPIYTNAWGKDYAPGMELGALPPGELYTLRLWTKGVVPFPLSYPGTENQHGLVRFKSNKGLNQDTGAWVGIMGGWLTVSHDVGHSPQLSGGSNLFPGVVVEFAAWHHPELTWDDPTEPWIATQSDDVSSDLVTASSGLQFHYRLRDAEPPTVPVIG